MCQILTGNELFSMEIIKKLLLNKTKLRKKKNLKQHALSKQKSTFVKKEL